MEPRWLLRWVKRAEVESRALRQEVGLEYCHTKAELGTRRPKVDPNHFTAPLKEELMRVMGASRGGVKGLACFGRGGWVCHHRKKGDIMQEGTSKDA